MCPESESTERLRPSSTNKQLDFNLDFECGLDGTPNALLLIKRYQRSSAGQQMGCHEVRCPAMLRLTMHFLLNITLNTASTSFPDRFHFIEDRLRSMTKDFCVQIPRMTAGDQLAAIPMFEAVARFRIWSHLLLCHGDELAVDSKAADSAQTLSRILNLNRKWTYSAARNMQHFEAVLDRLSSLYSLRRFDSLSVDVQRDQIEMLCASAFHKLADSAARRIANGQDMAKRTLCSVALPVQIRKHQRIKRAMALIDAFCGGNRARFFRIYGRDLTLCEQAVLYPVLDRFRVRFIGKMVHRKCVKMPPWNPLYALSSFSRDFGFDDVEDADHFVSWFGGFGEMEMERINASGLTADDLQRMKRLKQRQRFGARRHFAASLEREGLQRLIQSASYSQIERVHFDSILKRAETLKSNAAIHDLVDEAVNRHNVEECSLAEAIQGIDALTL